MEIKQAILVLSDISGYTRFLQLHTMSLLHAEKIITELLEAIIDTTREPLKLNKLEGDAILFYAETGADGAETAKSVLKQAKAFFAAFSKRSKELTGCNNLCPCDACRQADQLRLKTVLHTGEIALKQVRNFEEVAGEAVIVTHRLLKNSVPRDEYILMTQSFAKLSGAQDDGTTESRTEDYKDIGRVPIEVFYPEVEDAEEATPAKRSVSSSLANGLQLSGYAFARVLGIKKKAPGSADNRLGDKPHFGSYLSDCVRSVGMLLRRK